MLQLLLLLLLALVVPATCWQVVGTASQPRAAGSFACRWLPNGSTFLRFHHLNASGVHSEVFTPAVASDNVVSWSSPLPMGQYVLQAFPSGEIADRPVHLHAGYALTAVASPRARYSTAGRQVIEVLGSGFYGSTEATMLFADGSQKIEVPATVGRLAGGVGTVTAMTPAMMPSEWFSGCASAAGPVRSATCVPDFSVSVSVSLDGGTTTSSNALPVTFGFSAKLKVGFLFTEAVSDNGWTYAHNQGRIALEDEFGALINASTYVENLGEAGAEEIQVTSRSWLQASNRGSAVRTAPCLARSFLTLVRLLCGRMGVGPCLCVDRRIRYDPVCA